MKSLEDTCIHCIMNSIQDIPHIKEKLPRIYKELLLMRLSEHSLLTPNVMECVKQQLFVTSLQHLQLYHCDQVNDQFLKSFADSRRQLKTLVIEKCDVSDVGVLAVTHQQKSLETLVLKYLIHLTQKGLGNVKSPVLHTLNLKGCSQMNSKGVLTVLQNNPSIEVLRVAGQGNHKYDDLLFHDIAETVGPTLKELHFAPHTISDVCLCVLATRCPNLQVLSLYGCPRITGGSLLKLTQGCTSLRNLDLSYCVQLSHSPDNQSLWTLPVTLTTLSLCGIMLEDKEILVEALQRLRNLQSVRLCGIPCLDDDTFTQIMEKRGSSLVEIDLSGMRKKDFTDEGLRSISKYCTSLEILNISMCHEFTGESLLPLLEDPKRAQHITKLFLSSRKISYEVLCAAATYCNNLCSLDLGGVGCVDDNLLCLLAQNTPKLQRLGIKGCSKVTDTGLCTLSGSCQDLAFLVLSGVNNITDKSIFCIANNCPYLEEIYLNGCKQISTTTLQYLMDYCVSSVYIQHVTPNLAPEQLMAKNLDTGEFCRVDQIDYNTHNSHKRKIAKEELVGL
ncbi:F-box/LRR-repeat protein 2-like [Saccostrea echinata]|uniref:F-box/LRR-repeat protein 2-like n=1 Tax=Saccostrea echinata TaxID=191078 RepID=UPI002A8372CD|nr:F-box/LRR-repeat protein 2-like [Saccostrea echinata]